VLICRSDPDKFDEFVYRFFGMRRNAVDHVISKIEPTVGYCHKLFAAVSILEVNIRTRISLRMDSSDPFPTVKVAKINIADNDEFVIESIDRPGSCPARHLGAFFYGLADEYQNHANGGVHAFLSHMETVSKAKFHRRNTVRRIAAQAATRLDTDALEIETGVECVWPALIIHPNPAVKSFPLDKYNIRELVMECKPNVPGIIDDEEFGAFYDEQPEQTGDVEEEDMDTDGDGNE